MQSGYDALIAASERVSWTLDEVIPKDGRLDFSKPFLPEGLVLAAGLPFLSPAERLKLNQVRGNAYAHLFQYIEEYIVATCIQHAQAEVFGDEVNLRAMLRFAEEEVKHQLLFKRFLSVFAKGFGTPCGGIPSQEAVAGVILSKSPMAVMTITLHFEVMTQQHWLQCVSNADELDPTFKQMLKSHWAEESQHARLDALTLRKLATTSTRELRRQAVQDYLDLLDALLGLLGQQAEMDVESTEVAIGRRFPKEDRKKLLESQRGAYQQTFVTWGITNRTFVETVAEVFPEDVARIEQRAGQFAASSSSASAAQLRSG
jgi:hypothetical protein